MSQERRYEMAREQAEKRALHTLLRCYMREVAGPRGWVTLQRVTAADARKTQPGAAMPFAARIQLPAHNCEVEATVDRAAPVSAGHFGDVQLICPLSQRRQRLRFATFAPLLLAELAQQLGLPFNSHLLSQMQESVDVTSFILRTRSARKRLPEPAQEAYLASEQALVYGHPFHPTPKARSGLDEAGLKRYSPETGGAFCLHYFAVRRHLLVQDSLLAESTAELLTAAAPPAALPGDDWVLMPAHPWQAEYLLGLPLLREALATDQIRDLGPLGPEFHPTASLRTLYQPQGRFFYKMALSFRITNCLRRNALPELAAALAVSRIMRDAAAALNAYAPAFRPLEEQAYATVMLPTGDLAAQRDVSEGFGLMLRQSIDELRQDGEVCLLPASLFGNEQYGRQALRELRAQTTPAFATAAATTAWFQTYLELLLKPLLYLYFEVGLMFEPHLQNIVVGFRGGQPVAVYLRDYENGRLVASRTCASVAQALSPAVKKELYYSEEQAWRRFSYCLFGNHVVEAVRQLSYNDVDLEPMLWQEVRKVCSQFLNDYPSAAAFTCLGGLLAGDELVAKCNLLTRVTQGRDAAAAYVGIGNPWRQAPALAAHQLDDGAYNQRFAK